MTAPADDYIGNLLAYLQAWRQYLEQAVTTTASAADPANTPGAATTPAGPPMPPWPTVQHTANPNAANPVAAGMPVPGTAPPQYPPPQYPPTQYTPTQYPPTPHVLGPTPQDMPFWRNPSPTSWWPAGLVAEPTGPPNTASPNTASPNTAPTAGPAAQTTQDPASPSGSSDRGEPTPPTSRPRHLRVPTLDEPVGDTASAYHSAGGRTITGGPASAPSARSLYRDPEAPSPSAPAHDEPPRHPHGNYERIPPMNPTLPR